MLKNRDTSQNNNICPNCDQKNTEQIIYKNCTIYQNCNITIPQENSSDENRFGYFAFLVIPLFRLIGSLFK